MVQPLGRRMVGPATHLMIEVFMCSDDVCKSEHFLYTQW